MYFAYGNSTRILVRLPTLAPLTALERYMD